MHLLAWIITKTLNPLFISVATVIVVFTTLNIPAEQKFLWILIGFLFSAIPTTVLVLEYRRGIVSSLWSPTGPERRISFLAWVVSYLLFAAISFWFDAPRLILALALTLFILGLVNLILSPVFKISVHAELITLFVLLVTLTVSTSLIFLSVLILLVAWARLYLKAHTLLQITSGVLVTIAAIFLVFSLFGLVTF